MHDASIQISPFRDITFSTNEVLETKPWRHFPEKSEFIKRPLHRLIVGALPLEWVLIFNIVTWHDETDLLLTSRTNKH